MNTIAAKVRRIVFQEDDYNQTVVEQKQGKLISARIDPQIDAVIAQSKEEAIKMLRNDICKYLDKSQIKPDNKYFSFTISTVKIENNRFSMYVWFEEGTEYPVIGDSLE